MSGKRKKLLGRPEKIYAQEWASWYEFLENEEILDKYSPPHQLISRACKISMIKSTDCNSQRLITPPLPSSPYQAYSNDWISWYDLCPKKN